MGVRHTDEHGRRLLTIDDLAERHDKRASDIRTIIARENKIRKDAGEEPIPIADHCGRMALYDPRVFDKIMADRPGKGGRRSPVPRKSKRQV